MRAFAALALVVAALAGCLGGPTLPADNGPGAGPAGQERLDAFLEDHPTFCESEERSGLDYPLDGPCDYWDQEYHQFVVYDLDTVTFNMVVVPPLGVTTPAHVEASRMAAQAWHDGILEFAQPWLAEAFGINVIAVGVDVPTLQDVAKPDIVVLTTSAEGIVGIGLEPKQFGCLILGEMTLQYLGGHAHGDNWVWAEDCTGIGFTCFAINGASMDTRAMYDLIAHEIGHCLGAGHVGDALDFRARYAPVTDIMSYQRDPDQVNCVSNMNVRVLEGVYAHLLDRPQDEWLPRGSYYDMDPLEYAQVACANPPAMPIG